MVVQDFPITCCVCGESFLMSNDDFQSEAPPICDACLHVNMYTYQDYGPVDCLSDRYWTKWEADRQQREQLARHMNQED